MAPLVDISIRKLQLVSSLCYTGSNDRHFGSGSHHDNLSQTSIWIETMLCM